MLVKNTMLRDNSVGFEASGSVNATLDGVHAHANLGNGIGADSGSKVTVSNSVLADNDTGVNTTSSGGTTTDVMVTHSTITGSVIGIEANAGAGSTTRIVADGNAINNVGSAFYWGALGPLIYSPGNNTIGFNNNILNGGTLTPLTIW
jgi:hypothetical protein